MAELSDKRAGEVKSPDTRKWAHGKLMPIEATFWRWGGTVDGVKQPAVEITEQEFDELAKNDYGSTVGGGMKLTFSIDPTVVNANLDFMVTASIFEGFPDWKKTTARSINDVTGMTKGSLLEFAKRARSGEWYVEMEKVPVKGERVNKETGQREEVTNEIPKFIRMTKDLDELLAWNQERYPRKQVPENVLETAKTVFTVMAKGDMDKFKARVEATDGLKEYANQLTELAKSWAV